MSVHVRALDGVIGLLRTRRGIILASLLTAFLAVIILLPHVIGYLVRDWFNHNGAQQTQVEDVNFNLFTGKLEFSNLRVSVADDYTLKLKSAWANSDWLPLFEKTFYIKELYIQDTDIIIEQTPEGAMRVAGVNLPQADTTTPEPADTSTAWGFGVEKLNIMNTRITYKQPELSINLEIESALLAALHSTSTQPAQFQLAGKLNGAPLSIDARLQPFTEQATVDAGIKLQALPLTDFQQIAKQHVGLESGALSLDINLKASYEPKTGARLDEQGKIMLANIAISQAGAQVTANEISWQGTFHTLLDNANQPADLTLAGALDGDDINIIDQQNIQPLLGMKTLSVGNINLTTQQLDIDKIEIATLVANIKRDAEGAIVLPATKTAEPEGTASEEKEPGSERFGIRIGEIAIGHDSLLTFNDLSTTPEFNSTVTLNSVAIAGLDSHKPEQDTSIAVDGIIGKFSTLSAKGTVKPFSEKLALDLTADIKAMELPPLSAYTSFALGHNLTNGQLNTTVNVTIKNDIIDGKSTLFINNLDVKELTAEEKKTINTTASAPLSLGLSMLQDRDKNIELDLPFKGDLNSPEFDISDAINQAIGTAISKAALTYLTLSLQPFGALIALADVAGDISSGVQLQPVLFNPAESTMTPEAIKYKEKIATILSERPQLRLKVCGFAAGADRNFLVAQQLKVLTAARDKSLKGKSQKEQAAILAKPITPPVIPDALLTSIAKKRADAIKAALIKDHNIGADRLFGCLPVIDPTADAKTRVEIGI